MKKALVVTLVVVSALVVVGLLLQLLPAQWQSPVTWIGGTVVLVIAVLAGLAEITGYNLRTILRGEQVTDSQQAEIGPSIMIRAKDIKIDTIVSYMEGDLIQGDKVWGITQQTHPSGQKRIKQLVADIRKCLYRTNEDLPEALLHSGELALRLDQSSFAEWVDYELEGYPDLDPKKLLTLAPYRKVELYTKILLVSGRDTPVQTLPLRTVFFGYPTPWIVQKIAESKQSGIDELTALADEEAQRYLDDFFQFLLEKNPDGSFEMMGQLRLFLHVRQLESILDGVRQKIGELLRIVSLLTDDKQ